MQIRTVKISEYLKALGWWLSQEEKNNFDPSILEYQTLGCLAVDESCVMPYHCVVVIESLGLNPKVGIKDKLLAALEGTKEICKRARREGIREVWFMSSDPRIDEAAVKYFGFEKVEVYRKRLGS